MAFGLFTLLSPGQAAQVSLGLQTSVGTAAPAGKGVLIGLGAHLTLSTPINAARDLQVRGNFEGNLQLNGVPNILLDVTLIKQSSGIYYGGGIGSGVSFELHKIMAAAFPSLFCRLNSWQIFTVWWEPP